MLKKLGSKFLRTRGTYAAVAISVSVSALSGLVPASQARASSACLPDYALTTNSGIALRTSCGTATRQLTNTEGDMYPALSPDGSLVAFTRYDYTSDQANVWTVPAAGGNATQVTDVKWGAVWSIDWAADSRLVLSAANQWPSGTVPGADIYTVNLDGTGLTQFPYTVDASSLKWCGSKIVVEGFDEHAVTQLYTMNTDGSDVTALTSGIHPSDNPACTPDNRWVLYDYDAGYGDPADSGAYAIPITGGSPIHLNSTGTAVSSVSSDWTLASSDGTNISVQWLGGTAIQPSGTGSDPSFAHGSSTTPAPAGFPMAYSSAPSPSPGSAPFSVKVDNSSVGKVFGSIPAKKVLDSRVLPDSGCRSGREVATTNNTAFVLHTPTNGNVTGSRVDVGTGDSSYLVPGQTALYCVAFTQPNQVFDVRYDISDGLARAADAAMLIAGSLTPLDVGDSIDLANFISSVASIPQLQKIGSCLGNRNPLCAPLAINALMTNKQSKSELVNAIADYLQALNQSITVTNIAKNLPERLDKVITSSLWVVQFAGQVTQSPTGYVTFETARS